MGTPGHGDVGTRPSCLCHPWGLSPASASVLGRFWGAVMTLAGLSQAGAIGGMWQRPPLSPAVPNAPPGRGHSVTPQTPFPGLIPSLGGIPWVLIPPWGAAPKLPSRISWGCPTIPPHIPEGPPDVPPPLAPGKGSGGWSRGPRGWEGGPGAAGPIPAASCPPAAPEIAGLTSSPKAPRAGGDVPEISRLLKVLARGLTPGK